MNIFVEIKVNLHHEKLGVVAIFNKRHKSSAPQQYMTHISGVVL